MARKKRPVEPVDHGDEGIDLDSMPIRPIVYDPPPYARQIHPTLHPLAVPVGDLILDPDNARFHPQDNIDAIKASLTRFGQDQPLVVQKGTRVVRKGNGRLQAARELGWSHVAVVFVEEDSIDAAARAIADNRTAELAKWDNRVLSAVIGRIQAERPDFAPEAIGFTREQVERLHAKMRAGTSPGGPGGTTSPPPTEPGPRREEVVTHVRLVQLYLDEGTFALFSDLVGRLSAEWGTSGEADTVMEALRRQAGYGEPPGEPPAPQDGPEPQDDLPAV